MLKGQQPRTMTRRIAEDAIFGRLAKNQFF